MKEQEPLAVANYVIDTIHKNHSSVTNLQLQKILFFLQGYILSTYDDKPLISGKFLKWKYGPVQREVYQAFKNYAAFPIKNQFLEVYFKNDTLIKKTPFMDKGMLPNYNEFNDLILRLDKLPVGKLITITHNHESWKKDREKIMQYVPLEYTNKEIKSCFKENKAKLYDR